MLRELSAPLSLLTFLTLPSFLSFLSFLRKMTRWDGEYRGDEWERKEGIRTAGGKRPSKAIFPHGACEWGIARTPC